MKVKNERVHDWNTIQNYLTIPGTSHPIFYSNGIFRDGNKNYEFPVYGNTIDFLGKTFSEFQGSISDKEYWESSKPGLRSPNHPVQTMFAQQRFKYLDKCIPFSDLNSALDIGCGNGVGTIELMQRVNMVFGLDMSSYLLKEIPKNIIGIRCGASKLPLADQSIDFSMAWELIHHVADPAPVLSELKRVTRKWVVFFEPNRYNPLQAGFSLIVQEERLTLRNSKTYLMRILKDAKFQIVKYATVGCIFPNKSPLWLAMILRKIPFRLPYVGISHLLIAKPQ